MSHNSNFAHAMPTDHPGVKMLTNVEQGTPGAHVSAIHTSDDSDAQAYAEVWAKILGLSDSDIYGPGEVPNSTAIPAPTVTAPQVGQNFLT